MGYNLPINGVYWGYNSLIGSHLILTSCPGHPSREKPPTLEQHGVLGCLDFLETPREELASGLSAILPLSVERSWAIFGCWYISWQIFGSPLELAVAPLNLVPFFNVTHNKNTPPRPRSP